MATSQRVLVVLGSVREDSNTLRALQERGPFDSPELCHLDKMHIEQFRYGEQHLDDFMSVVQKMTEVDTVVFATPVYSSAMSAPMKIFFDRLSALGQSDKSLRASLEGKAAVLFATGSHASLPEGFEVPFRRTSEFLGMRYERAFYFAVE